MLIKLAAIGILLTYGLIYWFTKVSVFKLIKDLWDKIVQFLTKASGKSYLSDKEKFAKMNEYEKRKSKKYKFYVFINEILLDLGLKNKNVTVEGYKTFGFIASAILAILTSFYFGNIFALFFMFAILYILFFAISFSVSKTQHMKRKEALMNAEDCLCGTMSQGLVVAVEDNINVIDKSIRPVFNRFLDEIYHQNLNMDTAIDNINIGCGEQFDDFCKFAKQFEKERRPGMENYFQFNISNNSYVRALDRDCKRAFDGMNKQFFISMGLLSGFVMFTIFNYKQNAQFYTSPLGKFVLCMLFFLVAIQFVYIQYKQAKPFKYGE